MIKRYCDRCGQQIDEGVHAWYVLELHGTDGEFRHKELCEECYEYLCEKDEAPKADRKTEPTISKMEQVDKDINVRSKDEPQTENPCDGCVCDDGKHLMYCMNCKGIAVKTEPPKVEDEPQIHGIFRKGELSDEDVKDLKRQVGLIIEYANKKKDEPQTDCSWK